MKASEALKDQAYRCGSCGGYKHTLYGQEGSIILVCCDCENESKLTVSEPKLDIKWVAGSDGLISIF